MLKTTEQLEADVRKLREALAQLADMAAEAERTRSTDNVLFLDAILRAAKALDETL